MCVCTCIWMCMGIRSVIKVIFQLIKTSPIEWLCMWFTYCGLLKSLPMSVRCSSANVHKKSFKSLNISRRDENNPLFKYLKTQEMNFPTRFPERVAGTSYSKSQLWVCDSWSTGHVTSGRGCCRYPGNSTAPIYGGLWKSGIFLYFLYYFFSIYLIY